MVKIKSQVFSFEVPLEKVQAYLSDCANFEHLLPKAQVADFRSNETGFSFKAAGNFQLSLEKAAFTDSCMNFKGSKSNPFPFDLQIFFNTNEGSTTGHIEINAEVNMMLKMLIEKPLQKLLQEMAANLSAALH
jgi:carbon monoxide dehydrogenase subunit G